VAGAGDGRGDHGRVKRDGNWAAVERLYLDVAGLEPEQQAAVLDEACAGDVALRAVVVYIDTWSLFLGLDGNYSQYVIDPIDGERKKSRDSDGFHLSLAGNKILAAAINSEIVAALERRATQ
jgi:hypothetical protein